MYVRMLVRTTNSSSFQELHGVKCKVDPFVPFDGEVAERVNSDAGRMAVHTAVQTLDGTGLEIRSFSQWSGRENHINQWALRTVFRNNQNCPERILADFKRQTAKLKQLEEDWTAALGRLMPNVASLPIDQQKTILSVAFRQEAKDTKADALGRYALLCVWCAIHVE